MNVSALKLLAIAALLTGCASSGQSGIKPIPPSAVALDDAQIRSTLIGNKLLNVGTSGLPYSLSFNGDGTEVFQMSGNAPEVERWSTKDGVICFVTSKNPHECYRLKKDNDDYWFVKPDTGEVHFHYTLKPQ
ncbi:hypothetical protein [Pseudomonas sp. NA-150]|uniref:hypothetical protein n=1 Tax=Pseudomonas sp. NA-150 TaxID=3367525 RepID=UPI0037C54372